MFTNQFNRKTPAVKYSTDGCNDYFVVQPDLALTPAQMLDIVTGKQIGRAHV